jgi:hypothetical protein
MKHQRLRVLKELHNGGRTQNAKREGPSHSRQHVRGQARLVSCAAASTRSAVSNPSVNQP